MTTTGTPKNLSIRFRLDRLNRFIVEHEPYCPPFNMQLRFDGLHEEVAPEWGEPDPFLSRWDKKRVAEARTEFAILIQGLAIGRRDPAWPKESGDDRHDPHRPG